MRRSTLAQVLPVTLVLVSTTACDGLSLDGSVTCRSTERSGEVVCSATGIPTPGATPTTTTTSPPTWTVAPTTPPRPTTTVAPTTTTRPPSTTLPPPPPAGDTAAARLGWGTPIAAGSDEFNYVGRPDPAKWGAYEGPGHNGNGRRVAARNNVADGFLRQSGLANGDSAGLASTFGQRFGRWEVRARVNATATSGNPYRPVLITWPDSNVWPRDGEYDFFEVNVGDDDATAFLHYPNHQPKVQEQAQKALDITQWHNYGFEWSPSGLKGYIDGVEWFSFSSNGIQNAPGPMHQTIQLDNFFGSGMQAANFDVDWARVYKL